MAAPSGHKAFFHSLLFGGALAMMVPRNDQIIIRVAAQDSLFRLNLNRTPRLSGGEYDQQRVPLELKFWRCVREPTYLPPD